MQAESIKRKIIFNEALIGTLVLVLVLHWFKAPNIDLV